MQTHQLIDPTMQTLLFTFIDTIERALRLFGVDVFTVLDVTGAGPFEFESTDHGKLGREYRGLGLHVVVSRFPG